MQETGMRPRSTARETPACLAVLVHQRGRMQLELPVDEKWLAASGLEPSQAQREFRLLLAAKLFELGRLTLVQAAELAGMSVWGFAEALKGVGVSVLNLTPEQLAHDLRSA